MTHIWNVSISTTRSYVVLAGTRDEAIERARDIEARAPKYALPMEDVDVSYVCVSDDTAREIED